ncbi:hypothetical protein KIPB_014799, partial [Kipferlia bialata]
DRRLREREREKVDWSQASECLAGFGDASTRQSCVVSASPASCVICCDIVNFTVLSQTV